MPRKPKTEALPAAPVDSTSSEPVKAAEPSEPNEGRVPPAEPLPGAKRKYTKRQKPPESPPLDPAFTRMIALAPLDVAAKAAIMLAGIQPRFRKEDEDATVKMFHAWAESVGLTMGPGWQYLGLVSITIFNGIQNGMPVNAPGAQAKQAEVVPPSGANGVASPAPAETSQASAVEA